MAYFSLRNYMVSFSRKKLLHTCAVEINDVIQMKIEIFQKINYYIETGKLKQIQFNFLDHWKYRKIEFSFKHIYRQSPIFSLVTKKSILANFMQILIFSITPVSKQDLSEHLNMMKSPEKDFYELVGVSVGRDNCRSG